MCFPSPKPQSQALPAAPAIPAVVDPAGADAKDAAAKARNANAKKYAQASGRQSTILTSSEGDTSMANTQKKTLLG